MPDELIKYGYANTYYNVARTKILRCTKEITHTGLNEHKLISAPDSYILSNKIETQVAKWAEKWNSTKLKNLLVDQKNANLQFAEISTKEAQEIQKNIDNILIHTLSIDDTVEWDSLKIHSAFSEPKPKKPTRKSYKTIPIIPNSSSREFIPKFNLIEKLFKLKREKKEKIFFEKFENAIYQWESLKKKIEQDNVGIDKNFQIEIDVWKKNTENWETREMEFYKKQEVYNNSIDELEKRYLNKDQIAVMEYCEIVLNNSEYPDFLTKNFEIEYNGENHILIVEYDLPDLDNFPRIKEVKYILSSKEIKEIYISETELTKIYENTIYKIALRTIHELFEADSIGAIDAVTFNGWVNSLNRATGDYENKCILSLQAKKDEFLKIKLANVDPKVCFKSLKGVASSKLSSMTPVQPIIQISKSDKRFVSSYDVADSLDYSINLAAMNWEDFEHLIREIFEKEFSTNGGEVKVTQASRDGGVDAIAFDPDPIRGGKIVIQAKRYTNTVGVSAVRDLYGTVMNEGATKGILVTTADYGPDAYNFAKNKPLTLMNGSNLLFLLEKHGHHVKIDLAEAKKMLYEGN